MNKKSYSIQGESGKTISMSLYLKKNLDGKLKPYWYAQFELDDSSETTVLCRWKGIPPISGAIEDEGDIEFEESRLDAEKQLQLLVLKLEGHLDDFIRECSIYGHWYEKKVKVHNLVELFEAKEDLARCTQNHVENLKRMLWRFIRYMECYHSNTVELNDVTGGMLKDFLTWVCGKYHLSNRSYNEHLKILKRVFDSLLPCSEGAEWLKRTTLRKESDAVSREFFTNDELIEILNQAEKVDPLIYKMIVVASCTGLRLKDICFLKWSSISLKHNRISLTTFKTKTEASVGLWPRLRSLLETLWKPELSPADYVLPEAADQYKRCSSNLLERLRYVLGLCGYDARRRPLSAKARLHADLPVYSSAETWERVVSALEKSDWTDYRKQTARDIFNRYLRGDKLDKIAADICKAKSGICDYLTQMESLAQCSIVRRHRRPVVDPKKGKVMADIPESGSRARRASLRGWHSFKSSFVINALRAGVSMDTLSKILGNKTVVILFNHYVKIDDSHMLEAFTSKTPKFAQCRKEAIGV